jgi:hypothetical protein
MPSPAPVHILSPLLVHHPHALDRVPQIVFEIDIAGTEVEHLEHALWPHLTLPTEALRSLTALLPVVLHVSDVRQRRIGDERRVCSHHGLSRAFAKPRRHDPDELLADVPSDSPAFIETARSCLISAAFKLLSAASRPWRVGYGKSSLGQTSRRPQHGAT